MKHDFLVLERLKNLFIRKWQREQVNENKKNTHFVCAVALRPRSLYCIVSREWFFNLNSFWNSWHTSVCSRIFFSFERFQFSRKILDILKICLIRKNFAFGFFFWFSFKNVMYLFPSSLFVQQVFCILSAIRETHYITHYILCDTFTSSSLLVLLCRCHRSAILFSIDKIIITIANAMTNWQFYETKRNACNLACNESEKRRQDEKKITNPINTSRPVALLEKLQLNCLLKKKTLKWRKMLTKEQRQRQIRIYIYSLCMLSEALVLHLKHCWIALGFNQSRANSRQHMWGV